MQRPSSSGFLSIGTYGIFVVLLILVLGMGSRFVSPNPGELQLPTFHYVDFLPTPKKTAVKSGGLKKICHCFQEFYFIGETKIYRLETDHDGAPTKCARGSTEWMPWTVMEHCDPNIYPVCVIIKKVDGGMRKLPHVGDGMIRRVCNESN